MIADLFFLPPCPRKTSGEDRQGPIHPSGFGFEGCWEQAGSICTSIHKKALKLEKAIAFVPNAPSDFLFFSLFFFFFSFLWRRKGET